MLSEQLVLAALSTEIQNVRKICCMKAFSTVAMVSVMLFSGIYFLHSHGYNASTLSEVATPRRGTDAVP